MAQVNIPLGKIYDKRLQKISYENFVFIFLFYAHTSSLNSSDITYFTYELNFSLILTLPNPKYIELQPVNDLYYL